MADRYGDLLIYVERSALDPEPDAEEIGERAEDVAHLLWHAGSRARAGLPATGIRKSDGASRRLLSVVDGKRRLFTPDGGEAELRTDRHGR